MKKTITCPTCGLEHGLFWRVSSATDRQLSYRCNKVQKLVQDKRGIFTNPELHSFTEIRMAGTIEGAEAMNLPEELTAAYKKELQNKQQQQFVLMYRK